MKRYILLLCAILFLSSGAIGAQRDLVSETDEAIKAGKLDLAITKGEDCADQYPDSFRCLHSLGWAYLKAGRLKDAEQAFDEALELNDQLDNAYVGKGVINRKNRELSKARENYLKAVEISPENAEAYASLLVIELMEGHDEKAVEYGEKAWALRKDYALIPANLAVAYHYAGDVKKRDHFYEEAKRLGYPNLEGLREIFSGRRTLR